MSAYQAHLSASSKATVSFSSITAKAGTILKSLFATMSSMAIMWGISKIIEVTATAIDNYIHKIEKADEALQTSVSTYKITKSELESINSELKTQSARIDELLAKDNPTHVEKGELEELQRVTKELELQKALKDEELKQNAREVAQKDVESYKTRYNTPINGTLTDATYNSLKNTGVNTGILNNTDDLNMQIAAYRILSEERNKALADQSEDYEIFTKDAQMVKDNLYESLRTLTQYRDELAALPFDELSESQKETLQSIESDIKELWRILDPDKWNQIQMDSIFNTDGIEVTKDKLIELAKVGELDEGILQSYPKLSQAISKMNLFLDNGITNTQVFIKQMKTLGKESESLASIEAPIIFDISSYKESIDDFQSSISTLSEALKKINNGTLSDSQLLDLKQEFPSLADEAGNLSDAIQNLMDESLKNLINTLQSAGADNSLIQLVRNVSSEIEQVSNLTTLNNSIDSLQSSYITLSNAINEYNSTGAFTLDTLQTLLSLEPQYLNCLMIENGQLALNEQALAALANQRLNDAEAQAVQNAIEQINTLTEQANAQAKNQNANSASNAAVKMAGYNVILSETAAQAIRTANSISALNEALDGASIAGVTQDDISNVIGTLDAQLKSISSMRKKIGSGSIGKVLKPSSSGGGSSSSSNSSADLHKEAFEKELKELQYLRDKDIISETEYYQKLKDLNEKYFANREKYLDEYRKYEVEIYNYEKELNSKIMNELQSGMDKLQSSLKSLQGAQEELQKHGVISIDTLQELLKLEPRYLSLLTDENGKVQINEESFRKLAAIKVHEMQITYARQSIDLINTLTTEAKAAEWLADANHELTGTTLSLTEALLQQAVASAHLRGEFQGQAADTILQAYNNAKQLIGETNFSIDSLAGKEIKTAEEEFKELVDSFERRVKVLSNAVDLLEANLNNVIGSSAKNTLIDAEYGVLEERYKNYSDAMNMYQEMADRSLSKLDGNLQEKIMDGAVDLTTYLGSGNEEVVESINTYMEWADKVSDCKQELAELKEQLRQLELDKFNNIVKDFTDQFDIRESSKDFIKQEIALIEESGKLIDDSLYKVQINQTEKQLDILNKEKATLASQMSNALKSGHIDIGSEEWLEMVNQLSDVESSILDCETAIEEFNNGLEQLEIDKFNRVAEHFSELSGVLDDSNGLINKHISLIKESGQVVSDSLYKAQIKQTEKQLEILNQEKIDLESQLSKALESGYIEKGSDKWLEMINSINDVESSIIESKTAMEEFNNEIKQLEVDKFIRITDHFTNLSNAINDSNDLMNKQMGLLEESGELVGASYYTTQIAQLEKQLDILEQKRKLLTDQMNSSVISGIIQEGSDEWLDMVKSINEINSEILGCKTSMEELDNTILNLHTEVFNRIQEQFSGLNSELSNLIGLFDEFEVSDDKGVWTDQGLAQLGLLAQQYEMAEYQVQQYNKEIDELTGQYIVGRYSATEYTDKLAELTSAQWEAVNASESAKDAIIDLNKTRIDNAVAGIEKEIDAYQKLIDSQIEALESSKNLHDYEKSITEKTTNITDLEHQIAAMQNDNSAATVAKKKKLEEQLAEAKKTLEEAEYEHSIQSQKDALNQQYEDYEASKNEEIEALKASLENRENIINKSFQNIKANTEVIANEITEIAKEHGITISDTLITAWKTGENAIATYGQTLTTNSSGFVEQLSYIEGGIYALQTQANESSQALATMFATQADRLINELDGTFIKENELILQSYRVQETLSSMFGVQADQLIHELNNAYNAENDLIQESYGLQNVLVDMFNTNADNLINELLSSYNSLDNVNTMTNTLQDSLINTLERGYNISTITGALEEIVSGTNTVTEAVNEAIEALENLNNVSSIQSTHSSSIENSNSAGISDGQKISGTTVKEVSTVPSNTSNGPQFTLYKTPDNALQKLYIPDSLIDKDGNTPFGQIDTNSNNYLRPITPGSTPTLPVPKTVTTTTKTTVKNTPAEITKNQAKNLVDKYGSKYKLKGYARGGIITKDNHSPLDKLAEVIGEDKIVALKSNEGVLTPEQVQALKDFAPVLEDLHDMNKWMIPNLSPEINISKLMRNDRPNLTMHYDSLITVNGDINDTNHFLKQIEGVSQKVVNKTLTKIDREFRYH